jgi:hypothetical protein
LRLNVHLNAKRMSIWTAVLLLATTTGCANTANDTTRNATGFAGRTAGNAVRDIGRTAVNTAESTGQRVRSAAGYEINPSRHSGGIQWNTSMPSLSPHAPGAHPGVITQSVSVEQGRRTVQLTIHPAGTDPGPISRAGGFATDAETTLTVPMGWSVRISDLSRTNQAVVVVPYQGSPAIHSRRAGADVGGTVFGPRHGLTANRYAGVSGFGAGAYAGTPGAYGGTTGAAHTGLTGPRNQISGAGAENLARVVDSNGIPVAAFHASKPGTYAVLYGRSPGRIIGYIRVANTSERPSVTTHHYY